MYKSDQNLSYESDKPNHVRRLNFGQSILTLDAVKQFQGQKDGALLIDKNVADIPCTRKGDFVRKWIETHIDFDSKETSPVLGSTVANSTKISPVFGHRRLCKRARNKTRSNDDPIDNGQCIRSNDSQIIVNPEFLNDSIESSKRIKIDDNDRKENVRRNLFDSQSINVPSRASDATVSPILARHSTSYKRSRRKFQGKKSWRKALDRIENKSIETYSRYKARESPILNRVAYPGKCQKRKLREKLDDNEESNCINSGRNVAESCNFLDMPALENKCKILCSQKHRALIRKSENSFKDDRLNCTPCKNPNISEDSTGSRPSSDKTKLSIEDSPKDAKDNAKIEIESSNEDYNNGKDIVYISNDSDKDSATYDYIEDIDTQPVDAVTRNLHHHSMLSASNKSASIHSRASNRDLDETFFSGATQFPCKCTDVAASQKISQISTQISDVTDNRSSESGIIINTKTPPRETYADASVQLTILDSGKKRRKPKRGSLVEKLQSTINRQMSFVRIWRHRLKQDAAQRSSVPCATVYVRTCVTRFNRQFLEGVVIEDLFDLLSFKSENKSVRSIKIMTIPEVVGKIEMKSEGLVQIFPPWETLHDREPIFNVTYIRVVPEGEKDVRECNANSNRVKKSVIEEFYCPCIGKNKMIFTCKDRVRKPNIMEKVFAKS